MATIWNGNEMLENLSDKEAQKMVDDGLGQWLEKHDGSAFKHRSELPGYENKAMATATKTVDAKPTEKKKESAKKKTAKKDS